MPENMTPPSDNNAESDQQLEVAIADYIRACETGTDPDRREILERHPELADELRQFFGQRDRMNQMVEPIRGYGDALTRVVGPGQQLSYVGNYELLGEIARGGMGVVYKARQTTLGRIVAVKMIVAGRLASEDDVKRFQVEAQAAASLQHPNIVSIHEVGQHEGWHYFSMDYVEGRDLSAILRENLLPAKQAATYVRQMAEAIHYAHQQGTLHRDLKPSNILIDSHDQVRITDFGLAMRVEGGSDLTRTGQIVGTPSYMPPEQAQGQRSLIGPGSDVYSLGAILYECLTGRAPFRADSVMKTIDQVIHVEATSPRLLNPGIARDLETICLKCLQKEPHRRYGTAQLLSDDLGRFLRGEPIAARPISRHERLWRWGRRKPLVASLSAVTILSLVGIAVVSTLGYWREADLREAADDLRQRAEKGERAARDSAGDLRVAVEDLQTALTTITEKHLELEAEQGVTRQLNSAISDLNTAISELEEKRRRLNQTVDDGERELSENLIQLARSEWLTGDVVRADLNLEKCPERLRGTEWHRLKRLWLPDIVKFDGHSRVAFSPDAAFLAMAAANNTVEVWEVKTHRLVHSLTGHTGIVTAVSFSPDGAMLASGSRDQMVRLWSLPDGKLIQMLNAHAHPVSDVAFSRDGKRLATASFDPKFAQRSGEVILWNRETWKEERRLPGHGRVAFGPNGDSIAIRTNALGGNDSVKKPVVQVWNLKTLVDPAAQPFLTIPVFQTDLVPIVFSPDGQAIAVIGAAQDPGRETASLEIWSLPRKELQQRLPLDFQVHSLAFSPDTKRLACGGRDGFSEAVSTSFKVVTFNLITGERDRIFPWYQRTVTDVAYDRDGRQLATATAAEIKVWDVTSPSDPTQAILASIPEHNVGPGDWPQWGGSTSRINTPAGKNIPVDWDVGTFGNRRDEEDGGFFRTPPPLIDRVPKGSRNIKWAVPLGSQTYGNPVVANGRIFVGTNNSAGYLKRYPPKVDLGVLLCFEEKTGNFLWQDSNPKLPTGRVHDWPLQGVCSTPVIDGNRLWYVTNRCEVVCLDTEGFHDGEDDGPTQGNWTSVFSEGARLHYQIISYLGLPPRVQAGFSEANLRLPQQMSIGTGKGDKSWTIHEQRFDAANRQIRSGPPIYHIEVVGDKLRVSKPSPDGQEAASEELFSLNDNLLPDLGTPRIVVALTEKLKAHGITLLPETEPVTEEPGQVWSFVGLMNGEQQAFQVRANHAGLTVYKQVPLARDEADVVWRFDMMTKLGVRPHNMSTCSMITVDGMLFVCTSNGMDETHLKLPAPNAPSFMAMDRATGKVLWTDNSPGMNILHAQWASPSYGVFDGQPQVIFPGGDGWVYGFDPKGDGKGGSRLLWKFDANPKESIYQLGGRSTRNQIISFPAIYDGLIYIVVGEDPEHGEGAGHLWCIDPAKRINGADVSAELAIDADGKIIPHRRLQAVEVKQGERAVPNPNSAVRWHYAHQDRNGNGKIEFEETFHRSISIPVIKDDILYIADFSGLFHCLNAKTGKCYWTFDLLAACWGSALLVDGHVYICDEDGDVCIFRHSADPHIAMKPHIIKDPFNTSVGRTGFLPINARWDHDPKNPDYCNMVNSIYMTPIVANNVLYIATKNMLYAIRELPIKRPADIDLPDATNPSNQEQVPDDE